MKNDTMMGEPGENWKLSVAIQPETIAGRKEYFRRRREIFVATWWTDSGNRIHIPLERNHEALISPDKKHLAAQFTWHLKEHGKVRGRTVRKLYVEAHVPEELRDRYGENTSLHRVVIDAPKGVDVDHKDGDGLNCTNGNLRLATKSQNGTNKQCKNPTGFRGVRRTLYGTYNAQISVCGKNKNLGTFKSITDAARAYNNKAQQLFGDFAILNSVPESECQS